jgi:hypothetical protein
VPVEFGRATGNVHCVNGRRTGQQFQEAFDRLRLHDLSPLGARFDVAVLTRQVA